MKEKNRILLSNLISVVLLLGLVGLYAYVYYYKQLSEGVGLYVALKAGAADRKPYDIAAALARVLCLIVMTLIPSISTKKFAPVYLLRRAALIVLAMPTISLGAFFRVLNGIHFGIDMPVLQGILHYLDLVRFGVPLLAMIILAAVKMNEKFTIVGYLPLLVGSVLACLLSFAANSIFIHFVYLTYYLCYASGIIIAEKEVTKTAHFEPSDILTAFLYISAFYRLYSVFVTIVY